MKIKSILFSITLFCLFHSNLFSQVFVGPFAGAKYGDLQKDAVIDFFETKVAPSAGLIIRKETKSNFYYTGTITFEKMGWLRTFNAASNVDAIYVKGSAVALSLDAGYYPFRHDKFKLGFASGLKAGTIYNSTFDYFPKEPNTVLFATSTSYITLETRIDLSYRILKNIHLSINPNYSFLLRQNANDYNWRNAGRQASLLFDLSKS